MALTTCKVEFSPDNLSVANASASWINISDYVYSVDWSVGKASDLDGIQAGSATLRLDNSQRYFEPDYTGSPFSPNIRPFRRFRITVTADAVDYPQGIWYAQSWDVAYDVLPANATTTVSLVDGTAILALDTLSTLTPPGAATYADVVLFDSPVAYFPLDEVQQGPMNAAVGNTGQYKGGLVEHARPSPVTGDAGYAASFTDSALTTYGRSLMDDVNVFSDAGAFTVEIVANVSAASASPLADGPSVGGGNFQFQLQNGSANVRAGGSTLTTSPTSTTTGSHHHCATWDGSVLNYYKDGVLVGSVATSGSLATASANEYLYVGNEPGASSGTTRICSGAAFYAYALTATQVAAHATAAINLGYATQTTGNRVASLATSSLWSTAGITGGQAINVAPIFQIGQSRLEEIQRVAQAEQALGLFWFNDNGDPSYQGWDYTPTIAATFSDNGTDGEYVNVTPKYDDDVYNTITIAREGGTAQTRTDSASVSEFFTRGYNQTGLILATDADADLVAASIAASFTEPLYRFTQIELDGITAAGRLQILTRDIGDTIRVKIRTDTGEPVDVITRILGKHKTWTPDGNLTCVWNLSRGFDASLAVWDLGVTGYSELNTTTILG